MKRYGYNDFTDDGGTPGWRGRHEIDIEPEDRWASWRALPFITKAITIIFLMFFAPAFIVACGVVILTLLYANGIVLG